MTSANSIEFDIYDEDFNHKGHFRRNRYCIEPKYSELLKYQPLDKHLIIASGYDEEDEYWEEDPENLETFMKRCRFEPEVKNYFSNK